MMKIAGICNKTPDHLDLAAKLIRPLPRMTPDAWAATNRFYPAHTGLPGLPRFSCLKW